MVRGCSTLNYDPVKGPTSMIKEGGGGANKLLSKVISSSDGL